MVGFWICVYYYRQCYGNIDTIIIHWEAIPDILRFKSFRFMRKDFLKILNYMETKTVQQRLEILSDAAKYNVSCASS
jgi:hypothetical protein